MKVPLSWLKEFVDVAVEPARIAADLTLAGLAVDAVEPHGSDVIFDLDITTNRVDCMNVYGVAREVSVLYRLPLRSPDVAFSEDGPQASDALGATIQATDLCPRFCARVFDVTMGEAPAWMRDRLEAVGMRSINNVVDVTNYVMLEMGQPTHAFDLALIPEGRLVVRWARDGESLRTLDGTERTLGRNVGVVAGPDGALALAGIMGGASSEVSEGTRAIALEAAYWQPLAIRRGARALGMHTEASHRFERGADPEAPSMATARIAHLLAAIGAGRARPGLVDVRPGGAEARTTRLRPDRLRVVLGTRVPEDEWRPILTGLGFGVAKGGEDGVAVTIPTWRGDVSREVDVVEEVARHRGLDKVPSSLPAAGIPGGLKSWQRRERAVAETLVGAGLSEVVHYAFVSEAEAGAIPGPRVSLENPLSEEQAVLRNSLVVPGLLGALRTNIRHGRRDVRLFEIGRVFSPGESFPAEERRLGLLLAGAARDAHWSEKPRAVDFFDAKGLVELVFRRLGAPAIEWRTESVPWLHPGRSAAVVAGGEALGYVGSVHPDLVTRFGLREEAVVAEIRVESLLQNAPAAVRFRPLPRFPPVSRDVSILCDASVTAADLEAQAAGAAGPLLRSTVVADRYEGPPVPAGKVSLMLGLLFQHPERTLEGEEVQAALGRVIDALRASGAEIRGE